MSRLKVSEVFCYICRGILIEPVTLPCFHVFCFSCFEQSMQETSYSCPLCRKRISNWARNVKKNNNLVNQKLWTQIKHQFKDEVQLKLNGEDDGLDQYMQEEYATFATTSKPGEVAQEFSKFLNDFKSEINRLKEAEELASKEYIIKLKEEEERQLQVLQENNNTRIKEDSMLAMKIQEEINKEITSPTSSETIKKNDKRTKKFNKTGMERPSSKGPMDEFLKGHFDEKRIKENISIEEPKKKRSTSTDSTDSIRLEMNLFKPIKTAHTTPPKQYPDGRFKEISLTKVTPLKLNFNNIGPSSSNTGLIEGKKIHSPHSAFVDTNIVPHDSLDDFESPSKRLRFNSDDTENSVLKEITLGENTDIYSSTIALKESTKKKLNPVRKSTQENLDASCNIPKFDFNLLCQGKEKSENDCFETQDHINFDPSTEEKIIEEQLKIEKMILQEKQDRELAIKLSQEWESEFKKKPQTRSMKAAAAVKNVKSINRKTQQTLMESISSRTRNQK